MVAAVNWVIACLVVVALALVYWFAWRPLPQRSGTIMAPVSQSVRVEFDRLGEPHIHAVTEEDALVAQGYVTAQDRLWQMDTLRRAAAGEVAEIAGPVALENDREARLLGLRRAAEADYLKLPAAQRAELAAYARGVNAFISTHLKNLPLEFTLLGYQPRPWSAVDSILIGLQMFRTLTSSWKTELRKRDMLRHGDPKKVDLLFAIRAGNEVRPGSNAWAIAGSRTRSGHPLLSNDMHLEPTLPGIWYMTHLQAGNLDVAGVSLPGTPGVLVGHNQRIAWGFTNSGFDVQDLYIEKLDQRTGRYLYDGHIEQARPDVELIRVKGRAPVEMLVWVTRHGPVIRAGSGETLALRWTVQDPGIFQFPLLDFDKAQNWDEFQAAMSRFPGPAQNVVYADAGGNIGYHVMGKLPKRRGYRGDVPVDGSSAGYDWDGYIPFDQLPSAFNPPSGMIVTANQDPFPKDYPYPVNGDFASNARARQILNRLSARQGWEPEQMLSVQTDVYSPWLLFLAKQIVAAYDKRSGNSPALEEAVSLLRAWNGQMDKDLAAPFLAELAYRYVRKAFAESAAPGAGESYEYQIAPSVLEKLLRERPAGWFPDYDGMLLQALVDANEEAGRIQGHDPKRWRYGASLRALIYDPVVHQIPLLGKYFDIGPVPMSGSGTTVKQTTPNLMPSMRMTAEPGAWDHSLLNELTGESGQILSRHFRDQWRDYYAGRSYPMEFQRVEAASTLTFTPSR
ncbi:MAG TPA: penicillin acylase family protein [Bryobacteraceae bacterium]|nr:penicillin acylase family protein [Bryobacteraceae bacterium]